MSESHPRESLFAGECCAVSHETAGRLVACEREHGHGGAHTGTIDDPDDPFIYKVSWWPNPAYAKPDDQWAKAACGCFVGWDGNEWLVTATSFLCDHKQGDHVDGGPPADGRTVWERGAS